MTLWPERARFVPDTFTTTTAPRGAVMVMLEAFWSWVAVRSNTSVPVPDEVRMSALEPVAVSVAVSALRLVTAVAREVWAGPN